MVTEVASVENCYIVWHMAFSTMLSERKNKRSVGTLASIFLTWVAGLNWRGASVFRGEGGSPSTTATIMVGSMSIRVSTRIVVG